ncbi:hypothetical protein C2G38_1303147 [Gigaspora rosea]|uniref:Uncharacterized protein n=1 Tax=Gigaspora rosea TaxID=44941 RepID=A0A397VAC5_9GLOM|nr:hypothetical protein C2G38_1303147 [Gigaspora rosea]
MCLAIWLISMCLPWTFADPSMYTLEFCKCPCQVYRVSCRYCASCYACAYENKNARHIMGAGRYYKGIGLCLAVYFCVCANPCQTFCHACANPCQIFCHACVMPLPNVCVCTYVYAYKKAQVQNFRHGQLPGLQNPSIQLCNLNFY